MKISLTEQEWKILRAEVSFCTDLVPTLGEQKKGKIEFEMTPDDLDELNGYVCAEANHARNKRIQKILDQISDKIEAELENEPKQDT
jgi:hypothetical protein